MGRRVSVILAGALLCLAATASWADLAPYSQDFEGLDQSDPAALANDGWLVFANVFTADGDYFYGYGGPAPNGGPGFSGIDLGQGGPSQGDQQLVVYSDYNNGNHGDGSNGIIETNVFREQFIGGADVGSTWRFEFDAKRGNIDGATTILIDDIAPTADGLQFNFFGIADAATSKIQISIVSENIVAQLYFDAR